MAKQRWNEKHYKQVKVNVDPQIAAEFKAACEAAGVSMASELGLFMSQKACMKQLTVPKKDPVATRPLRRKALRSVIDFLQQIQDAEEGYMNRIPENLQGGKGHDEAEDAVNLLGEAIQILESIY
jgi:hypothetical protein